MALKLITEMVDFDECEILTESNDDKKNIYRIRGPFLQAEVENKNGRIYKKDIIEREVKRFNEEKIIKRRALGELDHPQSPVVNLERVSHIIESLQMDGNNAIGVARLINTPNGRIAQTLVREQVLLGVSSRGVGSLKGKNVNEDYRMSTIDIVNDPSAPDAFVNGVLEGKEYIIQNNQIVEVALNGFQKKLDNKGLSGDIRQFISEFLDEIKSNLS